MFLGVGHAPISRGRGPSVRKIFGTAYMRAHSMGNKNQILHGDHIGYEENFCMVDYRNADAQSVCGN